MHNLSAMNRVFGVVALCVSHVRSDPMGSVMETLVDIDSSLALLQTKARPIRKHDPPRWGYDDVDAWEADHEACGGNAQSPVDIASTLYDNTAQDTLDAAYLPVEPDDLSIQNNGLALTIKGSFGKLTLPDGIYNVIKIRFHCPSEHSIDGELSSCEMHIFHQREGSSGRDDLAVVGVLFDSIKKVGATESSGLVLHFLRNLGFGSDLPTEGESRKLESAVDLRKSFGEALTGGYYHYQGSLTNPPCAETVHWYVLRKKAPISRKMVEQFKMMFPDPSDNRPVQLLNGREVVSDKETVFGEFAEALEHPHWEYSKPALWSDQFSDCAGTNQSPINLVGSGVDDFKPLLPKFDGLPVDEDAGLTVINDGHTVQVNGKFGVLNMPDGKYNVLQFHFHMPSEHQVEGQSFAGEMQIVCQKEGATETNDLVVIGILLQQVQAKDTDDQISKELDFFRRLHFGELPAVGTEKDVKGGVDLVVTFAPQLGGKYYHYQGSMTTPPCSETVHWYVMETPAHVATSMAANFHELFPSPMNSRPLQELNGRTITYGAMATGDDEFD